MNGETKWPMRAKVLVTLAAAVFAVALGVMVLTADPGTEREAVSACERAADARLKAPATADYSLQAGRVDGEGGTWVVVGAVDSENGFGAKVRTPVRCEIAFGDAGTTIKSVQVG